MSLHTLDFPEPDSPTIPRVSPLKREKLILSTALIKIGDLNKVTQLVKLTGFVNCTNDFTKQPLVINGCSDLMKNVFGEKGVHARAAVGVNSLPLGFSVEIEAIFQIQL